MHVRTAHRLFLILGLAFLCVFCESVPTVPAQSGGGSGGGSTGGIGPGGGGGSGAGRGKGRAVAPSNKSPETMPINPQLPSGPSQQRDRAQKLEQQLREGQVNPPTPQTEMSDRLDQLYKNQSGGPPGTTGGGSDR